MFVARLPVCVVIRALPVIADVWSDHVKQKWQASAIVTRLRAHSTSKLIAKQHRSEVSRAPRKGQVVRG